MLIRTDRLITGNPGDVKPVGHLVPQLRIDYGTGYRIYFLGDGERLGLMLSGGDKTTQTDDIKTAHRIAARSSPTGWPTEDSA